LSQVVRVSPLRSMTCNVLVMNLPSCYVVVSYRMAGGLTQALYSEVPVALCHPITHPIPSTFATSSILSMAASMLA
jgi:hypothetical protein